MTQEDSVHRWGLRIVGRVERAPKVGRKSLSGLPRGEAEKKKGKAWGFTNSGVDWHTEKV